MNTVSDTPVYDQMLRELAGFPLAWLTSAAAGDTFSWRQDIQVIVAQVAGDRSWVELGWTLGGITFTKQVPLVVPAVLAEAAEKSTESGESTGDNAVDQNGDDQ